MGISRFPILGLWRGAMVELHRSPRTIDARIAFMAARLREWGGDYAQTTDTLRAWLADRTGHTLRTYHDHFRAFYTWAVAAELLAENPTESLPRPPTPKPRPRPLNREDSARSLLAADGDLRAYLLLGRYAGLRAHEIAKFAGEDIDETSLYVFGKGGVGAVLPTHPALWDLAQNYPRQGLWFPSPTREGESVTAHSVTMRVSRHFGRLGIDGSSHRNRHLYGTSLLRGGANIRVVQELMRHADIATTIRYLGVDEEEKVAAIRALSA